MSEGLSIVGSSRKNGERQKRDFYPTPEYATQALMDREVFYSSVWEPACGDGRMSEVIWGNGYIVYSSDIFDYGYHRNFKTMDFLGNDGVSGYDIITNPPFRYAFEFVERCKKLAHRKFALFLKTVFLESQKRYDMFKDTEFPLKCLYQFSKRVPIYKNGVEMKNSGLVAYAWFVWDREYEGNPFVDWIL